MIYARDSACDILPDNVVRFVGMWCGILPSAPSVILIDTRALKRAPLCEEATKIRHFLGRLLSPGIMRRSVSNFCELAKPTNCTVDLFGGV